MVGLLALPALSVTDPTAGFSRIGKGGFTIVVTENISKRAVADVAEKYKKIRHVNSVFNLNKVIDPQIPRSIYPEAVREKIRQ